MTDTVGGRGAAAGITVQTLRTHHGGVMRRGPFLPLLCLKFFA